MCKLSPNVQGTGIRTGEYGGPLVLFDEQLENVVIISSLNNFMVSSLEFSEGKIKLGLMGSVTEIPKGESLEFLVVYADTLRGAFTRWGQNDTLLGKVISQVGRHAAPVQRQGHQHREH